MSNFSTPGNLIIEKIIDTDNHPAANENLIEKYELSRCKDWILRNDFKNVGLQVPDENLYSAVEVLVYLRSETHANLFVLADTSYASCCVDFIAAAHADADAIIHFGPACLSPHSGVPVLYIFEVCHLDVAKLSSSVRNIVNDQQQIFIFYDTRYHHMQRNIREAFVGQCNIEVSTIELDDEATNKEQKVVICGRSLSCSRPESGNGIFIGPDSMTFANLSLILPGLTWYLYNNDETLRKVESRSNRSLMKRSHLVEKIKDAQVVGVLIATLSVKSYLQALDRVKTLCRKAGKKCYTVAVGRPNVAKLANFPEIDVFILIACLENPLLLDNKDYYKPIASLIEVELALGGREWSENYSLDFRELLPDGSLYVSIDEDLSGKEDIPDVSLLTGRARVVDNIASDNDFSEENALVSRQEGTIVEGRAAEFLSARSWKGLEQNIGITPVETVTQGRSGLPIGYDNEGAS